MQFTSCSCAWADHVLSIYQPMEMWFIGQNRNYPNEIQIMNTPYNVCILSLIHIRNKFSCVTCVHMRVHVCIYTYKTYGDTSTIIVTLLECFNEGISCSCIFWCGGNILLVCMHAWLKDEISWSNVREMTFLHIYNQLHTSKV